MFFVENTFMETPDLSNVSPGLGIASIDDGGDLDILIPRSRGGKIARGYLYQLAF